MNVSERGIDKFGGTTSVVSEATGYFRVEKRSERWWLIDPEGHGFFSLALNHAEEGDLKHDHNVDVWTNKYGSRERWMREGVVKDIRDFGFNTLGWTQQWVSGDYVDDPWTETSDLRHSQGWTPSELRRAGIPYVQTLRFADIEDWNANPGFPDVFSTEFAQWCDHVARVACASAHDDPMLVGYFFVDVPSWSTHRKVKRFFPGLVDDDAYELRRWADKYYEVTTASVRRYDPHHLILGDRYNGNRGIPRPVLEAAAEHIDVLSVQYFPGSSPAEIEQMRADLARWHEISRKPIIIADIGNNTETPIHSARPDALASQSARGQNYVETLAAVRGEPWLVGWHWCGYVENPTRGWGLKDSQDQPYSTAVEPIKAANFSIYE